jgi:uncharacterized protein
MAGNLGSDAPHLPQPAPIEAYGNGGFRFGGMSHRGSLLCLPDGIWAWPVADFAALNEAMIEPVLARANQLDLFMIGAGRDPAALPEHLRVRFRAVGLSVDAMSTGAAVRTYNVLLAEHRRVGAGLIAVA